MKSILVSWIGFTDISSSKGTNTTGLGPIAQASVDRRYDEIHLISDLPQQTTAPYLDWLKAHTSVPVNLHALREYKPSADEWWHGIRSFLKSVFAELKIAIPNSYSIDNQMK